MSYDVLRIAPEDRVGLQVRQLTVSVGKPQHQSPDCDEETAQVSQNILDDISFDLQSGEMLAIMGGSGSGKTTLLNTLSQRLTVRNKGLHFSGSIGYISHNGSAHVKNAYMEQEDFLFAGLTVFEHLKYQADLRMPSSVSKQEKVDLINSLIEILEIESIRNQIMMTFTHKSTLSGGERRRVSLAVQLLNKPSLLFLDEPTTGLDTSSSLKLIHVLRKLASSDLGVTIILSIHQPRPEIAVIFDKICLLTRGGRLVYFGNLVYSFEYFSKLNLLPEGINTNNIMNFIMDLSVKDTSSREKEYTTIAKINQLVKHWKDNHSYEPIEQVPFEKNLSKFETPRSQKISFAKEVEVLTRRTWILTFRDRGSYLSMICLPIILGIIVGWMFYDVKSDLPGIRSTTSTLYVAIEIIGFIPLFTELERLWENDGLVFLREYKEKFVSIPGFLLSRKLGKVIPEDIPITFGFAAITYFMWGLRTSESGEDYTALYFWRYLAIIILVYFIGMASALACFAAAKDFPLSATLQNLFYQLQNSACGYFINAATMPVYVRWLKYCCYFWYAFGALVANQYTGWMGDCPYDDEAQCYEYSGNSQMKLLGFPQNWITEPICILVAWLFGFYFLTFIALRIRNFDVSMAKKKTNKIGSEEDTVDEKLEEKKVARDGQEPTHELDSVVHEDISIHLQNLSLSVGNRKVPFVGKKSEFKILNNISGNFDAGKVNVVMGPSGSGKTTLLNLISDRLSKSGNFEMEGEITLNNGQKVSIREMSSVASYVTQFDSSLIPYLTVRETFYYQALLRLPKEQHPRVPSIINGLIRSMGLMDCADILVGSSNLKGISGGERRRVSIGIRLLSKPKILFLDEPTSGLDSSTSVSILKLLQQLTRENGTTIITTIHQPSEAMFAEFGSLLLLSKGGNVVYNGAANNVQSYLASIDFHKSVDVNIADYILDVVSQKIDEDKEVSDLRIKKLNQEWSLRVSQQVPDQPVKTIDLKKYRIQKLPFGIRLQTIMRRQFLSSIRSRDALIARSMQVVFLAVVHTLFFAPLRNGPEGVSNRLGLIQEVLTFYFIGMINNTSVYPIEKDLFYQEFKDKIYNNFEFQVSYFINELIIEVLTCAFFSVLIVFAVGLPRTPEMFFSVLATCVVAVSCGESLGIMVVTIFSNIAVAINFLANALTIALFMAGTMSLDMPILFRALNYISPLKYGLGIYAELTFRGQKFKCIGHAQDCALSTGDAVLEYYGLSSPIGAFFGGLFTCFIVYRVIAGLMVEVKIRYFI